RADLWGPAGRSIRMPRSPAALRGAQLYWGNHQTSPSTRHAFQRRRSCFRAGDSDSQPSAGRCGRLIFGKPPGLLRGHGANVAAEDVRRACMLALWLEEAAAIQLSALSAGKPRYFTREEVDEMYPQVSQQSVADRAWEYFSSLVE